MSVAPTILTTAAMLDAMGRFVSNVGVPAAIAFYILSQLGPKLDTIAANQSALNTEIAIVASTCNSPRPQPQVQAYGFTLRK